MIKDEFKYIRKCNIQKIELVDVEKIFEWLSMYEHIEYFEEKPDHLYYSREGEINIGKIEFGNENEFEKRNRYSSILIDFVKLFIGEDVYIKKDVLSVNNNKKKFIGFITTLAKDDDKPQIYIQTSADEKFKSIGEVTDVIEKKFLLIYSSYDDERDILSKVLKRLGYDEEICSYIKNFIKTGNTRLLSLDMYSNFLKRRRLEYEYPFKDEVLQNSEEELANLSMEDTYALLAGEMSYDNHCPICNSIPTLNIKEENVNRLEKRNCLVAILVAKYKEKDIYVKIVCCKSCFAEYKDSLTEASIEDIEDNPGVGYKKMILKNTISTSVMSHDIINEVLISPDNWKIICLFNKKVHGDEIYKWMG